MACALPVARLMKHGKVLKRQFGNSQVAGTSSQGSDHLTKEHMVIRGEAMFWFCVEADGQLVILLRKGKYIYINP